MSGRPTGQELEGAASGRQLGKVLLTIGSVGFVLILINIVRPDASPETTTTTLITAAATSGPVTTTTLPFSPSTTITPATTATPSTLANPVDALVLTPTGIGDIEFGAAAEETVNEINLVLGQPDQDTGWTETFATCPGTETRVIRWSSLQIFLTNGDSGFGPEGTRHFFHYGHSIAAGGGEYLDLFTDSGLELGSNVGQLLAAYGNQVTISDDPLLGPFWEVTPSGSGLLWGTINGIDDESIINSINGGPGCGE